MNRTLDTRVDVYRKGVKITELFPVGEVGIKMNSSAEIKTSLSGEFLVNDLVDWLADELKPVAIIDGTEHHLGVFLPTTVEKVRTDDITHISIEAYDKCWLAQNLKTEEILSLSANINYVTAIKSLLLSCGIVSVIATPTTATLTSIREDWDIGTSYITIINQLLSEINYNQLWFDNEGNAILEPSAMLNVSNVERTYDYNSIESMMLPTTSAKLDLFSIPNVFLCVCSNPDKSAVMTAKVENRNTQSPFSIQRRNKKIMKLYKLNNIASQQELNDYAQIECNKSMFQGQKVTISTAIRIDCGCNDVVALITPDVDGLCVETEWDISLTTGGTMTHVLQQQARVQ